MYMLTMFIGYGIGPLLFAPLSEGMLDIASTCTKVY